MAEGGLEVPMPAELITAKHDFVVLGFTGAPASGKGMWAGAAELKKRLGEDYLYEESISAPAAFAGKRAETERYARIADSVIEKLGDRKELVIIAHSMGGAEALLFLEKISADERFNGKKIDLVVFSPINYGTDKWQGVWGWEEGTKRILEQRDVFESHIAYPLPYEAAQKVSPYMTERGGFEQTAIKDAWRDDRRKLFEETVKRVEGEEKAQSILAQINWRDTLLTEGALQGKELNRVLLEERSNLIAPYIGALLEAKNLDPESQRLLSDIYKPDKGPMLFGYLNPSFLRGLAPHVKRMFSMSVEGFTNVLRGINIRLKLHDISLETNLVYMENDKFEARGQAQKTMEQMKVDQLATIWALADSTHFTVSYQPQMMIDVVKSITKKDF